MGGESVRGVIYAGAMLLGALLLQAAFFPAYTLFGARPDLVTLLVILFGLFWGPRTGALLGAAGGLAVDLLIGRLVGLGALTRAIIGWASGLAGQRVFSDNWIVPVLAVLVGTIAEQVLYVAGASVYGLPAAWTAAFFLSALATGWYGALLTVPILPGVVALTRRFEPILDESARLGRGE